MDWVSDAPASSSGSPAQPPTTHCTTQPPELRQSEHQVQRTEHRIDADLIESIIVDPRVRIDLLLDESEYPVLPLSRKVFREAVACGLLRLVRDAAGRVVKIETVYPDQEQDPSIEAFDEVFNRLFGGVQQEFNRIGSSYGPVTGGNPSGDSEVNWAGAFDNYNDALNLAERGETMQRTLAMLAGSQGDADTYTLVYGPGQVGRHYGGGSGATQL